LALASTASVADSEMADTRAETLVGMGSIVPCWPRGGEPIRPQGPRRAVGFPRTSFSSFWGDPSPQTPLGRTHPPRPPWDPVRFDSEGERTYTAWTGSRAVVRQHARVRRRALLESSVSWKAVRQYC